MVEINYTDVVMRIDIELRKKEMKRSVLEKECEVSGASVSAWAKGGRSPSCTSMARIADFLGVSLEWLLFGKERNTGVELSQEERELVEAYRQLSVQSRAVVLTAAKGLRQG